MTCHMGVMMSFPVVLATVLRHSHSHLAKEEVCGGEGMGVYVCTCV